MIIIVSSLNLNCDSTVEYFFNKHDVFVYTVYMFVYNHIHTYTYGQTYTYILIYVCNICTYLFKYDVLSKCSNSIYTVSMCKYRERQRGYN